MANEDSKLPKKIEVSALLSCRYDALYQGGSLAVGDRPSSWDDRVEGQDIVKTADGEQLTLHSDGQQSPPVPGQVLILRDGSQSKGYTWTLYGINP